MAKRKTVKREKGVIVHGTSLPYHTNGKVSLFTQELGKIVVEKARFEDLTTEGGISSQWYTWRIKPK
jgi:hypothetical protein